MYDVKRRFFVRLLRAVLQRGAGADEDFSEEFPVEGEGDAVRGRWILEVVGMEAGDLSSSDKMESDFPAGDFFLLEEEENELPRRRDF